MPGTDDAPARDVELRQKGRGLIPPQILDLVVPPIQVGSWCGCAGAALGTGAAIMKDASPWMSAIMTGTQWMVLGTTYWFSRLVAMRALVGDRQATSVDKLTVSAAAGVPTGLMMSLSQSRANVSRAYGSSIMFCVLTATGGQLLVNGFTGRSKTAETDLEGGHWLGGRWSPLKQLSDEEYIHKMDEKILRVDADIALIDERITKLREQQQLPDEPKA